MLNDPVYTQCPEGAEPLRQEAERWRWQQQGLGPWSLPPGIQQGQARVAGAARRSPPRPPQETTVPRPCPSAAPRLSAQERRLGDDGAVVAVCSEPWRPRGVSALDPVTKGRN